MKQTTNITLLVMVLSIPFALSQTRKAIPAGRYEALSGVKVSHSTNAAESSPGKDSLGLFWSEVTKHIPQGRDENVYFANGTFDPGIKALLSSKGVKEAKTVDSRVNILLSDNLDRDGELFKKIKMKGSLIVLKDKHNLKEVISALSSYDVTLYQSESDDNYYLLKLK